MITSVKKHTIDDFKKIEEGKICQFINGEIIMSPSPSSKHQRVSRRILSQILIFLENNNMGEVFYAPLDVFFNEENACEPDILFISKKRLHIIKEDGVYGAPDLIIEILSPSNSYQDLKTKKKIYEKHGVKEYWIIDPIDGEAIGFVNNNNAFKEIFCGNNEFQITLLNLKIKFEI